MGEINTDGKRAQPRDNMAGRSSIRTRKSEGLGLRVTPAGKKVCWSLRYRTSGGEQRRLSIGTYPAIGQSATPRRAAWTALAAVANGQDPASDRQTAKAAAAKARRALHGRDVARCLFRRRREGAARPNARAKRETLSLSIGTTRTASFALDWQVTDRGSRPSCPATIPQRDR